MEIEVRIQYRRTRWIRIEAAEAAAIQPCENHEGLRHPNFDTRADFGDSPCFMAFDPLPARRVRRSRASCDLGSYQALHVLIEQSSRRHVLL